MTDTVKHPELAEQLQEEFRILDEALDGGQPDALRKLREEAMDAFRETGFPTKRMEAWKYTNPRKVLKQPFRQLLSAPPANVEQDVVAQCEVPGLQANRLVFVNGRYVDGLSKIMDKPDKGFIGSLAEGMQQHPEVVTEHLGRYADYKPREGLNRPDRSTGFSALNLAFARDGAFIWLPEGSAPKHPIHILHIADGREAPYLAQPRHLIVSGPGSSATVIEAYHSLGEQPTLTNVVNETVIDRQANMDWYKLHQEAETAAHVGLTQVEQQRDSQFCSNTINWGGQWVRNDLNARQSGPGGETTFYGLYHTRHKQHVDNHTLMDHAVPYGTSNELYRGVLDGRSTGVFNGKVLVRQDAQKTNAFQANNNVLLTDKATINTKPQLEIFADDVKCSHGATIGELNEDELFYCRSRGISAAKAKALLLYAFASKVISKIKPEPLRMHLGKQLEERLIAGNTQSGK